MVLSAYCCRLDFETFEFASPSLTHAPIGKKKGQTVHKTATERPKKTKAQKKETKRQTVKQIHTEPGKRGGTSVRKKS